MSRLSAFIELVQRTIAATPSRDLMRAAAVGLALTALFVGAVLIDSGWRISSKEKATLARASERQSDDDLTTGSIVFVPNTGDTCRENEIDNATWEIREIGEVPCQEALAQRNGIRGARDAPTRLDVIRESFRKSDR